MEKIESFNLVIDYLKDKAILTTNGKNRFYLIEDKIVCRNDGSSFKLSIDDFKSLYQKDNFYIFEDNSSFIDDSKDYDYYRYYKK